MELVGRAAEGCLMPKLLGCYEAELHGFLSELRYAGTIHGPQYRMYPKVTTRLASNGCCPSPRVMAFDSEDAARRTCRAGAAEKGVKVEVDGLLRIDDFARYPGKVLVWCDIEGAQAELL